ncbi:REC8 meiotic recombination protein b [Menidia menidia]
MSSNAIQDAFRQFGKFKNQSLLAATRGIRVTRREFLRVNVKRTCSDILDYVTAQVPSPQPNQPRPRFSLYLSSQLQYGVIVVYHRQCGILLQEVQQIIERLLRSKKSTLIDMAQSDRMALEVPDDLHMMEESEAAQDPFFGLMESHQLPSPYKIQQLELVYEEADIRQSLERSAHAALNRSSLTPASITLREKEPFVISTAEYFEGDDLPEATAREIDLLLDQPDLFRGEAEGQPGQERNQDIGVFSIDQLRETTSGTERDSVWLLDEETGQPVEVPLATLAHERTPSYVAMPTPTRGSSEKTGSGAAGSPYKEVPEPPLRKQAGGRRRQLVFADPEVQISDTAMHEQIGNPAAETLDMSEVMLDFSSLTKHETPAQLFGAPCGSLLHSDILSLWQRQASIAVLPGSEETEGAEGESDMEVLRAERKRTHSRAGENRSDSGLQPAESSSVLDVLLDVSKEDRSVSDLVTPISRWSPPEEAQPPMEPIAEENIEMPEGQIDLESRDMLSWISSSLQRLDEVTFDSLLPPEADRLTTAHTLHKLLELLSANQVTASQTRPYSRIIISSAPLRMTA